MKHVNWPWTIGFVIALAIGSAAATLLGNYWLFLFTGAVIAAIALKGIGLVAGRAGMIALSQMAFAGIGAWTVAYLNVWQVPGTLFLWVPIGGLVAVPFGIAIALPALRLRGIHFAIVTLGFAAAFDSILAATTFPGQTQFIQVPRPPGFTSVPMYFYFVVAVYAVISIALDIVSRTPLGASWVGIKHSERGTAAHGVSVAWSKLTAFAIAAFVSGVSGGLLAGQLQTLVSDSFNIMVSLIYYAVTVMAGAHLAEGALIGGMLIIFFPELMRRLNLPQDIGNIAFALGATQALSMGGSIAADLRGGLRRLRRKVGIRPKTYPEVMRKAGQITPPPVAEGARSVLSIKGLGVKYGQVVALDNVDVEVPEGAVIGLIGPNGAGKSTLIDAVTGFLPSYQGAITLDGGKLDGLDAHKRARAGLRRTWQTTRIPAELTVGSYLNMAARRGLAPAEMDEILQWIGCPHPSTPIATVDVGTRRLLDVAGVVAARPKIVLLDEPAAGQSYEESLFLAQRITEIPEKFGASVVLVEHDIDMVRKACNSIYVLDFGRVIAAGPPAVALEDPDVVRAYVGAVEEETAA
ncbi:branched-chain amino acid ABC transporter ATP-binding protein/permease [Cucumibacter marinus]|uniref:branched-chain amino acid ABC transporter ATP-binding protein/permease n=1 Tax=Cucumibacter marinus TaxID=1121252 RepID=UPI000423A2D4|nr:ATP-binding cassette domain-containing protein [Cucumibacter marinus]